MQTIGLVLAHHALDIGTNLRKLKRTDACSRRLQGVRHVPQRVEVVGLAALLELLQQALHRAVEGAHHAQHQTALAGRIEFAQSLQRLRIEHFYQFGRQVATHRRRPCATGVEVAGRGQQGSAVHAWGYSLGDGVGRQRARQAKGGGIAQNLAFGVARRHLSGPLARRGAAYNARP